MKFNYRVVTCMLSCPCDVEGKLNRMNVLADTINKELADAYKTIIRVEHFKTHVVSSADGTAQSIINEQLVDHTDILIVVFQNHFGEPVGDYLCGCDAEIHRMINRGMSQSIHIFFPNTYSNATVDDATQIIAIENYKHDWKGIYSTYENDDELMEKVRYAIISDLNRLTYGIDLSNSFTSIYNYIVRNTEKHQKAALLKSLGDILSEVDYTMSRLAYDAAIDEDECYYDARASRAELFEKYSFFDAAKADKEMLDTYGL